MPPNEKNNLLEEIASLQADIARDRKVMSLGAESRATSEKNKLLHERLTELERELAAALDMRAGISTFEIKNSKSKSGEATAVVLASDWHVEERIDGATINGLNEYTLAIAEQRIHAFFVNTARLIESKQKSITVKTLILALLGDFISGYIHEELVETAQLPPVDAIIWAQNQIASGIEYLLANTDVQIRVPCHSGNHGRTTRKVRFATEAGNSLEFFAYNVLADWFRKEKRITFIISPSYHSHADVAGFLVRFHHGHAIRYGGGVGGVYIPVNKAISQWNKSKMVSLDCFGHFHQLRYGGNFVLNGALIGFNAFALSIKADFERPKQAFFLINHLRREVTDFSPIWLD